MTTEAEFTAEIVGIWTICDQSAFGTTDDIGIEILDNHRWYTLYESGGQLVRSTDPNTKGKWTMSFPSPNDTQLTLARETGGYNPMGIAIGNNPRMIYMDNSGFYEGWYNFFASN